MAKMLPDKWPRKVKVVNCAGCGDVLHTQAAITSDVCGVEPVAGRIKDRPYCAGCLQTHRPPGHGVGLTARQAAKLGRTSG